jgi:hypothetical protein
LSPAGGILCFCCDSSSSTMKHRDIVFFRTEASIGGGGTFVARRRCVDSLLPDLTCLERIEVSLARRGHSFFGCFAPPVVSRKRPTSIFEF